MRETAFTCWLERQALTPGAVSDRISSLRRIAGAYGDLDRAFAQDGMRAIWADLVYSSADRRLGRPNPSRLTISGDLYGVQASMRTHLRSYRRFREKSDPPVRTPGPAVPPRAGS